MDAAQLLDIIRVAAPLLAIGGAFGGAKMALNGTKIRVRHLEARAVEHELKDEKRHIDTIDRLARIETKLDGLMER